jgi:hypothetical protein
VRPAAPLVYTSTFSGVLNKVTNERFASGVVD